MTTTTAGDVTDMDQEVARIIANIRRDELAIDSGHELSEDELDADMADRLNDALLNGPVRVRVMAERSYWRPRQEPGSDIRLTGDHGREGWVRSRVTGRWGAYVEDMTPGGDSCPTRYHRPHSLVILPAVSPSERPL